MEGAVKLVGGNIWQGVCFMFAISHAPKNVSSWLIIPLADERMQGPTTIALHHIDTSKPGNKSGVAQLAWNTTGSLLFARFGQLIPAKPPRASLTTRYLLEWAPNVLYLYDFPSPQERFQPRLRSVLLHRQPVLHA